MTSHPEVAFVVGCVCERDVLDTNELMHRAEQILDWSGVAVLSADNRVTNFVLRAARSRVVPLRPDIEHKLADASAQSVAENMLVDLDLKRALTALGEASIRVIALKGPGLARTVYGEPSQRPYDDIDLAVEDGDLDRVAGALERVGFREVPASGTATSRDYVSTDSQTLIELHDDLLQMGLPPKCDADRWRRAMPIPGFQGAEMLALEDQVIQLSIHAHKHGFNRLIWLKDIDMVVRKGGSSLDWELIEAVSRHEDVQPSVWLALDFARAMLGTPIPSKLLRSMQPGAPTRLLYRAVWPPHGVLALRGQMRRRAVQLNESESWRGMAPSAVFMGRRTERLQLLARHIAGSLAPRVGASPRRPTPS
jgi:Uncharacterised nucleotidyltransferase